MHTRQPLVALSALVALSCGAVAGSNSVAPMAMPDLSTPPDLTYCFGCDEPYLDLAMADDPAPLTPCGDSDPTCFDIVFGPPTAPFPISSNPMVLVEMNSGLIRDPNGYLVLNGLQMTGTYSVETQGCGAPNTIWRAVNFGADVPPNTTLTVQARAGYWWPPDMGNTTWSAWTTATTTSPLDLLGLIDGDFIQVQFTFKTAAQNASPVLKSFDVAFECQDL